jgi:hypothetical protein
MSQLGLICQTREPGHETMISPVKIKLKKNKKFNSRPTQY